MKEFLIIYKEEVIDVIDSEEELDDVIEVLDKLGYKDKIHIEKWTINDD